MSVSGDSLSRANTGIPIEIGTCNTTAQLIHLSLYTPGNLTPIELQGPFSIANSTSLPSASLSAKILSSVYLNHV